MGGGGVVVRASTFYGAGPGFRPPSDSYASSLAMVHISIARVD